MIEHNEQPLTQAGRARRDAMLDELIPKMRCIHQARSARRTVIASIGAATVILCLSVLNPPRHYQIAKSIVPDGRLYSAQTDEIVQIVRSNPAVMERFVVDAPSQVEFIDDVSLLETLAAIDRPSGLVRSGGRSWLTANVTDPIRAKQEASEPPASAPSSPPTPDRL